MNPIKSNIANIDETFFSGNYKNDLFYYGINFFNSKSYPCPGCQYFHLLVR